MAIPEYNQQPFYTKDELKAMAHGDLVEVAHGALRSVKHFQTELDRLHDILTMGGKPE